MQNMYWLLLLGFSLSICSTTDLDKAPKIRTNWDEHSGVHFPRDIPRTRKTDRYNELSVDCRLPHGVSFDNVDMISLFLDDELVKRLFSTLPDRYEGSLSYKFTINDTRLLTKKLKCTYFENSTKKNHTSELPVLGYFHCPQESSDCENAECPTDASKLKFCLWTSVGKEPCRDSFDPKWCLAYTNPLTRYCPVNTLGSCAAMAKDSSRIWYTSSFKNGTPADDDEPATQCLKSTAVSPISYKGKPLNMYDYVVLDHGDTTLRVDCPVGSPFYGMDVVPHWRFRWHEAIGACINHMDVRLNLTQYYNSQDITSGAETFLLDITLYDKESGGEAKFTYHVISIGTMELSIRAENDDSALLRCSFSRHFSEEAGKFKHTHWWTRDGAKDARINTSHSELSPYWPRPTYLNVSGVTEPREYQCHGTITFKSCSPYVSVTRELHSEIYKYSPPIQATTSRAGELSRSFMLFTALLIITAAKISV